MRSKKDVDTYRSLNANFDSTDEDFKKYFDGINARGKERQEEAVTIHEKLKSLLTAEDKLGRDEWAKVFSTADTK